MTDKIITTGWVGIDDKGRVEKGNLNIPYFWRGRRKLNEKGIVRVVVISASEYKRLKSLDKAE